MARLRREAVPPAPDRRQSHRPGREGQSFSADATPQVQCDIYNTTFSIHRTSPLFVGPGGLSNGRLQVLGNRLRETLVGDVVRGVEVGLDSGSEETMANAGVLEVVTFEWAAADCVLETSKPALQITLQYENALCSALLLPMPAAVLETAAEAPGQFLHLPLLLLRMPTPLKATIIDFLASMFDCRIAPLRLGCKDLIWIWEVWAREAALPTSGPLAKDAVLTIGFRLPGSRQALSTVDNGAPAEGAAVFGTDPEALGLKALDIIVPNGDLPRFLRAGRKISPGGSRAQPTPFTDALSQYVEHHLALDMSNPAVGVVRIACGGFVISESRIKIFGVSETEPLLYTSRHHSAIRQSLGDLVMHAGGVS